MPGLPACRDDITTLDAAWALTHYVGCSVGAWGLVVMVV